MYGNLKLHKQTVSLRHICGVSRKNEPSCLSTNKDEHDSVSDAPTSSTLTDVQLDVTGCLKAVLKTHSSSWTYDTDLRCLTAWACILQWCSDARSEISMIELAIDFEVSSGCLPRRREDEPPLGHQRPREAAECYAQGA